MRKRDPRRLLTLYLPLAGFLAFTLFPIYWTLATSLQDEAAVARLPIRLIPRKLTVENYRALWNFTRFDRFFSNSLFVAGGTTLLTLGITTLSGYALSRFRFKGKTVIFFSILAIQMIPLVMIVIPLFQILIALGLARSRVALVGTYTTFMITFCTLLMKGFMDAIPTEIDEMAMIDGCSRPGALFRIVLPTIKPGLVATGIFAFIYAWNELIFAVMFLNSEELMTLPVGLYSLVGQFVIKWTDIATGSIIAVLPPLLLFAYIQRYLVQGLASGAVKG